MTTVNATTGTGGGARAHFENGVLEVTIPAPERDTQRARRVEIS